MQHLNLYWYETFSSRQDSVSPQKIVAIINVEILQLKIFHR